MIGRAKNHLRMLFILGYARSSEETVSSPYFPWSVAVAVVVAFVCGLAGLLSAYASTVVSISGPGLILTEIWIDFLTYAMIGAVVAMASIVCKLAIVVLRYGSDAVEHAMYGDEIYESD